MRRRALSAACAGLVLALMLPTAVAADAELVSAVPAAGSQLTDVPSEIVLTFDEPLSNRSSITVVDASGATVATGALDPTDPTMLRGSLPGLAPGTYEVGWVADSADGHLARDTYTFTVLEPTAPPTTPTGAATDEPSTAPSPTAVLTPTPSPAPTGSGDPGGDATAPYLPIVIVGLLIGGGLAYFLRRRGPA